jgi:hypothetical protein
MPSLMAFALAAMGSRLVAMAGLVHMAGSGVVLAGVVLAGAVTAGAVFSGSAAGMVLSGAVTAAAMVIEFSTIVLGVAPIVTILAVPEAPDMIPVVPAQSVREPAPLNKHPVSVISF